MNWKQTEVLVTGGASFIGSTLVAALIGRRAQVRVVGFSHHENKLLPDSC